MQMTNLIFLSFILDREEEVISNVFPQARRLRNCNYHLLHGIISLLSLNVFVEFPFIFLVLFLYIFYTTAKFTLTSVQWLISCVLKATVYQCYPPFMFL